MIILQGLLGGPLEETRSPSTLLYGPNIVLVYRLHSEVVTGARFCLSSMKIAVCRSSCYTGKLPKERSQGLPARSQCYLGFRML